MIEEDFHGWTEADALRKFEEIVGHVRKYDGHEVANFITGNGAIKEAIRESARYQGLDARERIDNPGVLVVEIV
jgi:hypothetical protein